MSQVERITDEELGALCDGELGAREARELEARVATDDDARRRLEVMRQLGGVVRGHYQLATAEIEPKLAGMWARLEAELEPAPARSTQPEAGESFLERVLEWLSPRGLVMGAVGVAAGVLLAVTVMGSGRLHVAKFQVPVTVPVLVPDVAVAAAQQTDIEELDVASGSAMVFQVPSDDTNTPATTVIWVTSASGTEGPI